MKVEVSQACKAAISLIGAQLALSLNIICLKSIAHEVPIFTFVILRFALCAAILFTVISITRGVHTIRRELQLGDREWLNLAGQAFTAGFAYNSLLTYGMQYTTATSVGVISSTLPGVLAIFAQIILKEKIGLRGYLSIFLNILGVLVMQMESSSPAESPSSRSTLYGDLFIFLSLIPESLFTIISKSYTGQTSEIVKAMMVNFISALMLAISNFEAASYVHQVLSTRWYCWMICVSSLCACIFYTLWPYGLKYVPASHGAMYTGVLPVATSAFAILLLGEKFTINTLFAIFIILGAIVFGTTKQHSPARKRTDSTESSFVHPESPIPFLDKPQMDIQTDPPRMGELI